jgi:hypothetical protein
VPVEEFDTQKRVRDRILQPDHAHLLAAEGGRGTQLPRLDHGILGDARQNRGHWFDLPRNDDAQR